MQGRISALVAAAFATVGCNVQLPVDFGIELSGRSPVPVDAEVDRILTEWQKRRADTAAFYAKFKRTVREKSFNKVTVSEGAICYRHPNLGRVDVLAGKDGKGREIFLYSKGHEFWHVMADERRIERIEIGPDNGKSVVFEYMRSSPYVWFVPTDKTTLQKHGAIRKVKEEGSIIELRVENARRAREHEKGYDSMTVFLRKPELLPSKLIIKENADSEVTYEFSDVTDRAEISESDFIPPKFDESTWKITRLRLAGAKQEKDAQSTAVK